MMVYIYLMVRMAAFIRQPSAFFMQHSLYIHVLCYPRAIKAGKKRAVISRYWRRDGLSFEAKLSRRGHVCKGASF